jgi:hypothetical protein
MASVITLKGIEQAISNLNYTDKNTLKYRLVNTIMQFYENESSVQSLQGIDTEELIELLWDRSNDPTTIKNRLKNLRSIKSSINTDLRKLYEDGKNPEGIFIGRTNIFVMSDQAKANVLKASKNNMEAQGTATLNQIVDILNIVNEILSDPEAISDAKSTEGLGNLGQLKNLIKGLSEKVNLGWPDVAEVTEDYEDLREIAEDHTERIEEAEPFEEVIQEQQLAQAIEELDEDEVREDLEDVKVDEELEEVEMEEDLGGTVLSEETQGLQVGAETVAEKAIEPSEDVEIDEATKEAEAEDLGEIFFDPEETRALDISEYQDATGIPYEAEAKEGIGDSKEIVGDDSKRLEEADFGEEVGSTEEIDLEETEVANVQGEPGAQEVIKGEYIARTKRPKKDEKN